MATIKAVNFDVTQSNVAMGGEDRTVAFTVATRTSLALNDIIELVKIPKGAILLDFFIEVPDLDSATSLTLEVGDLDAASIGSIGVANFNSRFVTASTKGQARAVISSQLTADLIAASLPRAYTANDVFCIKCSAASAGAGGGGLIRGYIRYNMNADAF